MTLAYHLHFNDPVHFGIEGIGQESIEQTMRSDSLWGAVLQQWFLLFGDEPDYLCRHTPFSVSSCFPLIRATRFFPLPQGAFDTVMKEAAKSDTSDAPSVKEWRQVKYIAEPLFRQVIARRKLRLADIDLQQVYPMQQRVAEQSATVIFHHQEQRPRIRTDQLNGGVNDGSFFYCTDQFFEHDSGLFFLADFEDAEAWAKFEAALLLLGDSGVGADRSTGRGGFTFVCTEVDLPDSDDASSWLMLSLYHPTRDEVSRGVLTGSNSRYSLVKRSGPGGSFHVSRYRRADCWMLAEGSVVPFQVKGDAPCVLEQSGRITHNIYRNGRAFCIPFPGGGF